MTRHEFLLKLHELLHPRIYLEIGIQHGLSLNLAAFSQVAIGIDPNPLVGPTGNQVIHAMTSDQFFAKEACSIRDIDLAFIDGMHLVEYAVRDFKYIEACSCPTGIIVFDDVLPRNQNEALRTQCPGDWTGDVWKVEPHLRRYRPDLTLTLIDTQPTGLLMVQGLSPDDADSTPSIMRSHDMPVPDEIINRENAVHPEHALKIVQEGRGRLA